MEICLKSKFPWSREDRSFPVIAERFVSLESGKDHLQQTIKQVTFKFGVQNSSGHFDNQILRFRFSGFYELRFPFSKKEPTTRNF